MECPTCLKEFHVQWQPYMATTNYLGQPLQKPSDQIRVNANNIVELFFELRWAECPNPKCGQLLVSATRGMVNDMGRLGAGLGFKDAIIFPSRSPALPIDPLVPSDFATDYKEAALILDSSPRASAVLSRRVLADLLEQYAGQSDYKLSARIDNFNADTRHPTHVREPLNVLRVMGDFAAHVKRDKIDQALVINVTRDEAEWTLEVLDRLFDYFIVTPAKDAEMKAAINEKRGAAGQEPIPDLPDTQGGKP